MSESDSEKSQEEQDAAKEHEEAVKEQQEKSEEEAKQASEEQAELREEAAKEEGGEHDVEKEDKNLRDASAPQARPAALPENAGGGKRD